MKLRRRFAWQFGLAAAAGAIFTLVTATTVSLTSIRNMGADVRAHVDSALFNQTKIGAEALLTAFAAALRDPLYLDDFTKIDKVTRAIAAASNIASVRVYGPEHFTIHDGSGALTHFGEPAPEALAGDIPHGTLVSWIDGDVLQFGMSVCADARCFGMVSVGFNAGVLNDAVGALDNKVEAAEHAFVVRVLTLAAIALGVAAMLANAFGAIAGRRFSGALEAAVHGIEQIARGDTDVELSHTVDAELDSLARSVEQLSRQLTATRIDRDAILANMIDGLAVTDPSGLIVLANPALAGLTGKSVEDLVGQNLRDLLGSRPGNLSGAKLAQAFGRAEFLTLSGGRKLAAMVAASTMDLASEHEGRILCVIRDVTERAEREAQLRETKQNAETAERAKAEFLANVSHEIRTPMNGVMAMAELLAKTELDTKQKNFTSIIVRSGQALVSIINDVLDFSKIDSGQLELHPQPFNLAHAVDDVATLVSAKAQDKELELIVRFQPDLPEMFVGDVGRIRQIITNLLGNAIKFTESGHVLVDVSSTVATNKAIVESQGRPVTAILVKVVDTGIGIPADKIDQVFEKFSQVGGSSTRKHEGTGLGLAISRKLVEQMDGKIGVDSQPGKGSTFWSPCGCRCTTPGRRAKPVRSTCVARAFC